MPQKPQFFKTWIPLVFFLCASVAPARLMAAEAPAQRDFKAALLIEHAVSTPWDELLRKGLFEAAREKGIEASVIIAEGDEQLEKFRKAAAEHDMVIVASENLQEILRDNAGNFRRTKFGVVDAQIRAPNVMCINFADEQGAFLAGVALALAAKERAPKGAARTIGWLSGQDIPVMRSLYNSFREGARLADPDIVVVQALVGSFTDEAAAAQRAQWLADQGATCVVLATGAGANAAKKILNSINAMVIEVDGEAAPGQAALVKAADKAVAQLVKAAADGAFKGKEILVYDMDNGGVALTGLAGLLANERADVRKNILRRVEELRKELVSGGVRVKSLKTRTLCDCLD